MSGPRGLLGAAARVACRYLLRPPLVQNSIRLRSDGRVLVELKTV